MTDRQEWSLFDPTRPWTANTERRWHHMERARQVRDARTRFYWLAKAAQVPRLDRITITATPHSRDRRWRPDVAACYPTVKAAIDGLVDAQVIPDDTDQYLTAVTFHPVRVTGRDGLHLTIRRDRGPHRPG